MQRLWRYASDRPSVFAVTAPGSVSLRWELDRSLRRRVWQQVASPAAADVLAVLGRGDDEWRAAVARVWDQLPGPRARVDVLASEVLEQALDGAAASLLDRRARQDDEQARTSAAADSDMAEMDRGGVDMDGMDHRGMDGMDMPMPGGLPEASRAEDRDGLRLDVLTLQLGPALVDWPAGLVLRLAIQGDVVQHGEGWVHAPDESTRPAAPTSPVPAHLDVVTTLLRLAGDARRAGQAARLLQEARAGGDVSSQVRDLLLRVRRSRALRWQLTGVGVAPDGGGADAPAGSDAWDRLLLRLGAAESGRPLKAPPAPEYLVALVEGSELAVVRLAVASTAPTDTAGVVAGV